MDNLLQKSKVKYSAEKLTMIKKLEENRGVKLSSTLAGQRELIREYRNKLNEVIDYINNMTTKADWEEQIKWVKDVPMPTGETLSELISRVEANAKREEREKNIRWISNYWKTLKQHGMTERNLIIKFNKFIDSLSLTEGEL